VIEKLLVNRIIDVSCLFAFERRIGTIVTEWKKKILIQKMCGYCDQVQVSAHPWYRRESVTKLIRILLELYKLNPFSGWQLSPAYFNSEKKNEC
jgi:hypothetical protein